MDSIKTSLWKSYIQKTHIIFSIELFVSLLLLIYFRKKVNTSPVAKFIPHFEFVFILLIGAWLASTDQIVTNAITPYLLVSIFMPIIIIIPPYLSIPYYLLSYAFFWIMQHHFQTNDVILLSNLSNGISMMLLGCLLSGYLWWLNLKRTVSELIIHEQNKRLEHQNAQLTELSDELGKLNTSKDKFFSIIAHDLRSPMNGFLGLTEIIADESNNLTPAQIQDLAVTMRKSVNHIYNLLDNLLEWSRVQGGQINFNPSWLDVDEIINSASDTITIKAADKNIEFKYTPMPGQMIWADKHMLELILRNLLSNALKYSRKDSIVTISTYNRPDEDFVVTVTDSGIGMTREQVDKLFVIGETIKRKGTSGEPSAGLGLVLCKEFAEMHSGTLSVESVEEKGSTFRLTLPFQQYPNQSMSL
jgi:signal transduction histidine kinase